MESQSLWQIIIKFDRFESSWIWLRRAEGSARQGTPIIIAE